MDLDFLHVWDGQVTWLPALDGVNPHQIGARRGRHRVWEDTGRASLPNTHCIREDFTGGVSGWKDRAAGVVGLTADWSLSERK